MSHDLFVERRQTGMTRQQVANYRLFERLGKGGMGEVYRAEDLRLKRLVAIKFLSPELFADGHAAQHFLDEARAAAALNHPGVATIYEVGQTDGLPYIAMEYVAGETLAAILNDGPTEISTLVDLAVQVAEAIQAAHARGIIHCDLKSSNLMLTPDGRVKVLDFGLARRAVEQAVRLLSGTTASMSPEQVRGEPLDVRTDLFSFGVVLYEMATGRPPFQGEGRAAVLQAILNNEPPPLRAFRSDLPLELESIVRKTLEKNRNERYQSAEELLRDLIRLRTELGQPQRHGGTEMVGTLSDKVLRASVPRWRKWLGRGKKPPGVAFQAGAAFRGLLPFQEADRDRFYGREMDTQALCEMIAHDEFRFGVLYGESGCGKTSLIRAGLVPKLWDEGYAPMYCRSYNDPLAAILEECRKRATTDFTDYHRKDTRHTHDAKPNTAASLGSWVLSLESSKESVPISEICGYLRSVADELNSTLVIICDQFEEFFVNFKTKSEREPFLSFVAGCTNTADLPVKFLFSIRSDFLYLISAAFDDQISEPLLSTKRYHLRTFDEEQAEAIIEKSVERANVPFEPGLSCQVARDLAVNDRVLPSELQIVGEQLQQKRIFTLKEYRRAGGKEPLVYSFLEEVIQASGDQEAAKLLLRSLISEENTRLTLTLDEIAHRTERSRKSVVQILNLFVESRLIREIQEDEPWRYELTHEYLIEKVNQITGRVMDATQRANRMFRQYMSSYVADQRTRIPISKLWFIRRYSDVERGERERELLRKSLRWGLLKASALVVVVAMVTTLVAAVLSVNEEWEEVRLKDGHTAAAMRAIFSPDGRLLVSCGEDGKVIVWDFMRRERLQTFTDHTGWVRAVAFSPDGKWFATSGGDEKVIVWDAARLEKAAVLTGHKGRVMGIAFSPDGRMLATGSGAPPPGQLILWEAGRWEKVRELDRGLGYGNILFTPDSRYLLNPHGAICDLSLSQCVSGDVPWLGANWIALSPNASRLVGVHPGGEVMFSALERSGNSLVRKFLRSIPAHRFHGRSVAFSPDGRWLASAADDIVLWDAATQTKLAHLPYTAESWSVAFSPDGQWLVSSHSDGAVLLWSVTERELVANFNEHSNSVRAVAFSRDGKKIASASEDRSIIIWNAEDGRKETVLSGHDTRVTSVGFSPDGKSLASCDQQSTLIFWDLTERRPRWTFKHPRREPSYSVVISPDGRWIATSRGVFTSAGGEQVVDTQELVDRQIQEGHIYGLDFSADGKRLACVTDGGQLHLWDVETWRLLKAQKLTPLGLITVSFSPDGKRLVTGEDEGAIRLWDVESLKQIALIGRHSARIKKVAFSLDGRQVASAGEDQTIALWDVESRTLVTRIGTHTSPVLSLAWSPDGKRLASGEHDKSVRLYTRHRTLWGRRLD